MSSASRSAMLAAVRRALGRSDADPEGRTAVAARLAGRARNVVPLRAQIPPRERVALFQSMLQELSATSDLVPALAQVPEAVARYLASENLPAELRAAPDPLVAAIPWADRPLLRLTAGPARASDAVSVTGALCGVAETGTLMLVSGPEHPTTLNFLPDTHVVILRCADVVAVYEDGFDRMRARFGTAMPRTLNFVSGPSRSADIEQKLQLGAHGPRRLHVILVDDGNAPEGR